MLFVCTGNSARSPIAEALLRHRAGGHVEVASAGSHPKPRLHPDAVRVLREEFGIDIAGQRPRHLDAVTGRRFDYVISLCDKVREVCPDFRDHPRRVHWSIPDPATRRRPTRPAIRPSRTSPHRSTPASGTCCPCSPTTAREGGSAMTAPDQLASVRYLVDDVHAAVDFYTTHLGFTLHTNAAPAFADVIRGPLRLLLSGPASSGARATPADATATAGRNRIHLIVDDLDTEIDRLRDAGLSFRSDLVTGPGGRQILLTDPAGNLIELFQSARQPASAGRS